jgi:hypothetical protein
LSRGSLLAHTSHAHPIIGTPAEVPVPRNEKRMQEHKQLLAKANSARCQS